MNNCDSSGATHNGISFPLDIFGDRKEVSNVGPYILGMFYTLVLTKNSTVDVYYRMMEVILL